MLSLFYTRPYSSFPFFSSSVWRYWGCLTPRIIENMKRTFGEGSKLDGYDELRPEDQVKVIKAWKDGHVADEDIPESVRKPAAEKPKKAKRAPAKSDGEDLRVRSSRPLLLRFASLLSHLLHPFINHRIHLQKVAKGDDDEGEEEEEEEKPKKKRAAPGKKAEPKEKAGSFSSSIHASWEVSCFFFFLRLSRSVRYQPPFI